jgi:hypothetical protein
MRIIIIFKDNKLTKSKMYVKGFGGEKLVNRAGISCDHTGELLIN